MRQDEKDLNSSAGRGAIPGTTNVQEQIAELNGPHRKNSNHLIFRSRCNTKTFCHTQAKTVKKIQRMPQAKVQYPEPQSSKRKSLRRITSIVRGYFILLLFLREVIIRHLNSEPAALKVLGVYLVIPDLLLSSYNRLSRLETSKLRSCRPSSNHQDQY